MITGINVVDPKTGAVTENMTVTFGEGRIASILPTKESDRSAASIDGTKKYLVPGYIDMHAHVFEDDHPQDALDLMLSYGITGWRQMSGSDSLLHSRSCGELTSSSDAPALLAMPGRILTSANAANVNQAVAEVERQKTGGADFIKTIFVQPKVFFAALQEANRQNLPYVGHLSPGVDAAKAAAAGMRSIEHLGPSELQLISCSKREWFIRIALAMQRRRTSSEHIDNSMKLAAANPILFRLQRDPHALVKTQVLLGVGSSGFGCRPQCNQGCVSSLRSSAMGNPRAIWEQQFLQEMAFARELNLRCGLPQLYEIPLIKTEVPAAPGKPRYKVAVSPCISTGSGDVFASNAPFSVSILKVAFDQL